VKILHLELENYDERVIVKVTNKATGKLIGEIDCPSEEDSKCHL